MARRAPGLPGPRRRTITSVPGEAASRMLNGPRSFQRSKSTSEAKDGLEPLVTSSLSEVHSSQDARLNDLFSEFDLELRGSRRMPRLETPPRWVPPWKADRKPQVLLRPVSPVKASRRLSLRSKEGDDMLSSVLNTLLPAESSKPSQLKELSPLLGLSPASAQSPRSSSSAEVLEFLGLLTRRFGNVKRGCRVMKQAAQSHGVEKAPDWELMSKQEFTWCVTSFLYHGDQTLACKLFAEMGGDATETLTFAAISALSRETSEGLVSLLELQRQLFDEFSREELEELLPDEAPKESSRAVKRHFQKLIKPLGIEACQAQHLFEVLGGLRELLAPPAASLWRDLRWRLVGRFGSVEALAESDEETLQRLRDLGELGGLREGEIGEIGERDAGREVGEGGESEKGSERLELLRKLQNAAPSTSVEDLWRRLAAEWPDLLDAARAMHRRESSNRSLGDLLLELLPKLRLPDFGRNPGYCFISLDLECFKAIAMRLDVSEHDSERLFRNIAESSALSAPDESDASGKSGKSMRQIFLDDFAEQLVLWAEGFDRRRPVKDKIRQLVAPARAAISALKAELLPEPEEKGEAHEEELNLKPKKKKKFPRLPWLAYYPSRASLAPVALS